MAHDRVLSPLCDLGMVQVTGTMNSGSSNSDEQLIDRRLTIRWGPTEEELIERQDTFNGSVPDETAAEIASLHGNSVRGSAGTCFAPPSPSLVVILIFPNPAQAAQRRAITELLFFACVGDLKRCQRIVRLWNLKVRLARDVHLPDWQLRDLLSLSNLELLAPKFEHFHPPSSPPATHRQVAAPDCCDYDKRTPL